MISRAPSADELRREPTVQVAFATAWADSFPEDAALRHEEGGYIYANPATGAVVVRRAIPGELLELNLSKPPDVADCFLVATYHTHPNPIAIGYDPEPSPEDRWEADNSGVPWFVISELGVFVVGPERRIGGFSGRPGYPI